MTFKYRYRKQIIISIIFLLILFSVGGGLYYKNTYQNKSKISKKEVLLPNKKSSNIKKTSIEEKQEEKSFFKVDIKGEIINPGLYSLEEGSRVSDVIDLAGGLTEQGDTTVINLSKKISDEMVIIIYSKEEVENFKKTKEILEQVIEDCKTNYEGIKNDACIDNETSNNNNKNDSIIINGKISINTATLEELETLPGIGEAKAQNIIKYREEHGQFQSIEELKEVTGIGEAIYDKIKENITL